MWSVRQSDIFRLTLTSAIAVTCDRDALTDNAKISALTDKDVGRNFRHGFPPHRYTWRCSR